MSVVCRCGYAMVPMHPKFYVCIKCGASVILAPPDGKMNPPPTPEEK